MRKSLRDTIDNASYDHSGVTLSNQDYILQLLGLDQADDILNVSCETNVRGQKMRPFPEPSDRGRKHFVAGPLQQRSHTTPAPRAYPSAVNKDEVHQLTVAFSDRFLCLPD